MAWTSGARSMSVTGWMQKIGRIFSDPLMTFSQGDKPMSMVQQQQEIASELIAMARKSGVSEELISAVLRPVIPGPDGAPSATELIAMQDRQLRRLQDIIRAAERQKDPNLKTTGPVKMAAGYGIPQQVGAAPVTQAPVT